MEKSIEHLRQPLGQLKEEIGVCPFELNGLYLICFKGCIHIMLVSTSLGTYNASIG